MANETTITSVNDLVQSAINEARLVKSSGIDLSDYITVKNGVGVQDFPIYGEQVMASIAEGTDGANTEFTTDVASITPGEHLLMATVTDLTDLRAAEDVFIGIGEVMREAKKAAMNQAIFALCDGFSTAVGTTNVDITLALIREAVATVRSAKGKDRLILPVSPYILADIIGLYNTASFAPDAIRDMAMTTGQLPMLEGVHPVMIDNLAAGTSAGQADAADLKTAVFSENALGAAIEYDFKIELERDASLRATEVVATASFGVGELKDEWGVELLVDNKD
jgi:hypothetical protein